MKYLTLSKEAAPPPPDPQADEVRVYADDAGAIRTIDHEGNDNPAGGGADGVDGTPVWQGDWSAGTYEEGQAVAHEGSSYVANTSTSDEPPSADWDVLAAKGEDGTGGSQPVLSVNKHLLAADVLQLQSQPFELVPPPGLGSALVPISVAAIYRAGVTPYDGFANLAVDYDGSTLGLASFGLNLASATDRFGSTIASTEQNKDIALAEDQALIFQAETDPTSGDGTLFVTLVYYVLPAA